ncbi:MAG: hydroxyacid dehydrogenase, partial [Deltaproteobacteria bacterium]|nr:hydroxyacid dehydrogenase [Deltaproteobacteria bacterium]
MKKPSILYYDVQGFQSSSLDYLDKYFELKTLPDPNHDATTILKTIHALFAPMGFKCDKAKIDQCPQLQVIGSPTTGLFHIDTEYASKRNIRVCSLHDQQAFLKGITATAELTWGLILEVTRRIGAAHDAVCSGQWAGKRFGAQTPKMLSNMSLGVLGLGRLGEWVARYARAFNMRVCYYDPHVTDERFIRCKSPLDLAASSEILSIHVHLSPETRHMVDDAFLKAMPHGAYVVNTSRGGVADEEALLRALMNGHLGGAALDMLENEHLPGFREGLKDRPLVRYAQTHDNLILTPKMGGCTVDAWETTEMRIV